MRLDSDPGADLVTVTLTTAPASEPVSLTHSGAASAAPADSATLTFATGNWSVAYAITVTAGEDDGDTSDDSATISHAVSSAGAYDGIAVADVTLLITDDDVPGVAFAPRTLTVEEEGDAGVYTVALTSEPLGGSVTLSATSVSPNRLGIDAPAMLTFSAADWSSAQTFTVRGVADSGDGNRNHMARITHATTGANYDGYVPEEVVVTVIDDDGRLTFASGESVDDQTYTIGEAVDLTLPTATGGVAPLSYALTPDLSAAIAGLTFDDNTRTVRGAPDSTAAGQSVRLTYTATDDNAPPGSVALTFSVTVEEMADIVVSPPALTVDEGGGGAYTVRLATNPGGDVTVAQTLPQSLAQAGVTFGSTGGATTRSLMFTATDWQTPQTVSVFAAEDGNSADESGTIMLASTSGQPAYNGLSGQIALAITDSDTDTSPTFTDTVEEQTYLTGSTVALTLPTATGNGEIAYALDAGAVAGLSFDAATRVLGGMPTAAVSETTLTYTATDEDGDASSLMFAVTVNIAPMVQISTATLTVDEGGAGGYTIALATAPSGLVTVTPGVGGVVGEHGVTLTTAALTFDGNNWNTAQAVSVAAAEDADTADETATISHAVTGYGGVTATDVVVTVTDNDDQDTPPAFASGESVDDQTYTAGAQITDLTLPEATGGNGDITYTLAPLPSGLVFTAGTRTLSGTASAVAAATTTTLTYTAADEDGTIGASDEDALTFTVTINPAPPAVVTLRLQPDALTVDEAAAAVAGSIYTVRLSSQPASDVTVTPSIAATDHDLTLTFDGAALLGAALTFVTAEWNDAQTVTVTAAADADITDDTVTITHAAIGTSASIAAAEVVVTVDDTSTPGITLDPDALTVAENASDTYTIRLTTIPLGDATITLTNTGAAHAGVTPLTLTFAPGNWNVVQSVTVSGIEDEDAAAPAAFEITHRPTNYGSNAPFSDVVTVTVTETDTRGVTIAPTALPVDEGDNNFYTVALTSEPVGTVVVTPDASAGAFSGITITPTTALMFDSGNWNTAQTVSVFAGEDNGNFDDDTLTITHAVSGYGSVTSAAHVVVTVDDNDAAVVTPAVLIDLLTLTIVEGAMDTYIVTLTTDPSGEVVVTPTSDNLADVPSPDALTFAAGAWNTPQTVTVTTNADVLEDFTDESAQITHTVSGYTGVTTAAAVAVTVTDNDTNSAPAFVSGVSVPDQSYTGGTPITALVLPEVDPNADGNGDITYTLTPIPAGLVFTDTTRTLSGTPNAVSTATTTTLTYTAADSDTETGAADEASQTFTVTVNPAAPVVVVTLRLEPDALTIDEGADAATAGVGSIYTVRLSSQPASDVTVTPSIAATDHDLTLTFDGAALLGAALTFVTAEWNDAQTVTVTAAADPDVTDDTVTITHAATGTSAAIADAEVTVTVTDTSTPGIALLPATVNVDEGATAIYGVRLDTIPDGGDVTVMLSLAGGAATFEPAANLTFSDSTWNTAQSVTVTATEDADATANTDITIAHAASGADYDGVSRDLTVTVDETDTRGVMITRTAGFGITEGALETYTVTLTSEPDGGAVTVTPSSDDAAATVSAALTFIGSDWDEAQTVTVTAIEDANNDSETATITHAVDGADYAGVAANDVVVTVTDNDTPGVTISDTTLTVGEGEGETYTVRLAVAPSGDVTVMPVSGDTTVATVSGALTFSDSNWSAEQTVTVTGEQDDDAADESTSITHAVSGADYASVTAADVAVTIDDDESASVMISDATLTVDEGSSTGTYTVTLTSEPVGGDVTVTPSIATAGDLTLSGALTFTDGNWNTAQTVTLTVAEDDDAVDDAVVITHAASGADYDGASANTNVTVTITDDEDVGITVSEDMLSVNESAFDTYTVVLTSAPSVGEVTVTPGSADTGAVSVTAALVFDAANWDTPQTVSVGGVPDEDAVDESVTISNAVTVSDGSSDYASQIGNAGDVTVTVDDSGTAAVTISTPTLTVAEDGEGIYTIVLGSAPGGGGDATVTPTSADPAIATVSSALTFSAGNWNDMQTVTVRGVADSDGDDDTVSITHAVSGYDNINTADAVAVTVTDIDIITAGVTLSRNAVTVAENEEATYTVVLDTQPSGNVTVTPASAAPAVATVSGALTFSDSNWSTAQSVTITGADDGNSVTDTTNITHMVEGADYASVTVADDPVVVTVTDDDTPRVVLSDATLTVNEGEDDTYTVRLDTQPSGEVTITPSSDNASATVSGALTFTTANWNDMQTVTVTATADDDATANAGAVISHTASGAAEYDGLTPIDSVTVTVDETNTRGVTLSGAPVSVTEGLSAEYTIVLTSAPDGGDVTVTASIPSNTDLSLISSGVLTFDANNWNIAQPVSLTAAHDDDAVTDDDITITHTVAGADYGSNSITAADVTATIDEDDSVGVTVSPLTVAVDEMTTDTYTVALTSAPSVGEVTVTASSADTGAVAIDISTVALVFDAGNWNMPQTISVGGRDDADADDESVRVTNTVTVSDSSSDYDGANAANVTVNVTDTDMEEVTVSVTTLAIDEDGDGTYTIVLTSAPSGGGDATVTPVSADTTIATVSGALIFGLTNWQTAQEVVVTGVADDDVDNEMVSITHTVSGYTASAGNVDVTVADTSVRGVTVPMSVSVTEGTPGTYEVVLTTQPTGNVTVTPASDDDDIATVSGALTFSAGNWDTAQNITVTGTQDADSADESVSITHAVTGADYESNNVTAANVAVTVNDDETAGVMISTATLAVGEGGNNTYTVELTTPPTGPVAVVLMIDNSDVTADATTLNFTVSNWNTEQTVTISAGEDDDGNDDIASITHTVSGGGYDGASITNAVVTVTVTDNDPLGIMLSATTLSVGENGTANYTVELATEPDGNVTITPTSADPAAATVSAALTFTDSNWNTAQQVDVTGVADDDATNESVNITHAASGSADYAAVDLTGALVAVTVTDNNTRGVTLSGVVPVTVAEGATANYGVVLDTQPTGDVMVTPTSDTPAVATVSAALVFGPSNWNTVQNIVVTGVEDANTETDSASITHAVTGADYASVTLANVAVTVTDNDMPSVTISTATLTIGEGTSSGADNTYNVRLNTQPSGAVVVTLSSDNRDVTTNATALTFTTTNWNMPQDVVVSAAHDADAGDDTAVITHSVSGGGYDGVTISNNPVVVTVTDDETAGVTITPLMLATDEGTSGGASNTYTVVLDTQPSGAVAVALSSDNSDVRVNRTTLNFTAGNWNIAQPVIITAAEDGDSTDDSAAITHTATGAAEYAGIDIDPVVVTVTDNDTPAVILSQTTPVALGEGEIREYTVVLRTEPTGSVMVTVTSSDPAAVTVSPSPLTFTTDNWDTPQRVVITAVQDDDGTNATVNITHAVTGYGSITSAAADPIVVTVTDDDRPGVGIEMPADRTVAAGETLRYPVRLNTRPSGEVVIAVSIEHPSTSVTSARTTELAVTTHVPPIRLTFTPANWNVPQTVTYTPTADDPPGVYTFTHSVVSGDYAIDEPVVLRIDVPTPMVVISTTRVRLTENITDTYYTIVLDSAPGANVVVTPDSDTDAVSVTPAGGLTFTTGNWNTAQTVNVTGNARATIRHRVAGTGNYTGVTAADVRVIFGDAEAMDALNDVILPEVAHVMVGNHINAITHRITQARTPTARAGTGLRANLGGHSTLEELAATHAQTMVDDDFDTKTLLGDSDFAMPLNADGVGGLGGANLALWGSGDYRNIGGDSNNVDWDGSLFSAHLGVDAYLSPDLLAGVMLAWSEADLEYTNTTTATATTGDYELDMTSLHPYVGWQAPDGRLDMWATAGYGSGELKITEVNDDSATADATLQTLGAGGSARLLASRDTELRLKGEVQATRLEVEQGKDDAFNEMEVSATQTRLALEATRTLTAPNGAQLLPSLELGMRYDGGDGATGNGLEVGAGLRYHNAARGLTLETRMRALLSHSGDTKDQGLSATLNLTPGADRQGLSLTLTPAYGNAASGVQNVWDKGVPTTDTDSDLNARMSVEVGYGFAGFADGLLTPYSEMTFDDSNKTYRMGMRWNLGKTFTLNLANERLEKDDAVAEDVYLLEGEVKF